MCIQADIMTISRRKLLAGLLLLRHRRKHQRHRRFWVHPVNVIRHQQGEYHQLFLQLKQHEDLFIKASLTTCCFGSMEIVSNVKMYLAQIYCEIGDWLDRNMKINFHIVAPI